MLFYYAFDVGAYYYDVFVREKDKNSCYAYGKREGTLATTTVACMGIFIGQ